MPILLQDWTNDRTPRPASMTPGRSLMNWAVVIAWGTALVWTALYAAGF